jgi:DNA-binding transcriptional LysR family regulator
MESPLDWSLLQSFRAIARDGSLSAAARTTGISQPTLGRHVAALEHQTGLTLFTRTRTGLTLTSSGHALLPSAEAMAEAAARAALAVGGRSETLAGTVRITASRIVSHHILPDILSRLRQQEPLIEIELVPTDSTENLLFREADIAVRMYRPTQLDVVTAHVADLAMGIYAARSYLDRRGRPATPGDLLALDFIGFDRSDMILRLFRSLGIERRRGDFPVRCDDQIVYWNLVRAGLGIGGMQRLVGDADPAVERIALTDLPPLPVWLTAPEALRKTPRIRRVWDALADGLRAVALPPSDG